MFLLIVRKMVNINFPRQTIQNSKYSIHQMQGGGNMGGPYIMRPTTTFPSMPIHHPSAQQSIPASMIPVQSPNMQQTPVASTPISMTPASYGFQGHLMANQQTYNTSTPTKPGRKAKHMKVCLYFYIYILCTQKKNARNF